MSTTPNVVNDRSTCTCGNNVGSLKQKALSRPEILAPTSSPLDASFVHLPLSPWIESDPPKAGTLYSSQQLSNGAVYFRHAQHVELLEKVARLPESTPSSGLCLECVQRIQEALEADTERLYGECRRYEEAIEEVRAREIGWKRAFEIAEMSRSVSSTFSEELGVEACIETLESETKTLKEACDSYREELKQLTALQNEQIKFSSDLRELQLSLDEESTALELEARAFDNEQEQLQKTLSSIEAESEALLSHNVKLTTQFIRLQVDKERGLRYPLINDLRLAYRPKGDVQWEEIQIAWSLAARLLLVCATIFDFRSKHWKIVPLSKGAKIIFSPPDDINGPEIHGAKRKGALVYNLGHPKANTSKTLLAWNALLHQVVHHVDVCMKQGVQDGWFDGNTVHPIPYDISSTKIDRIVLAKLDDSDAGSWSRAIHCMASILQWLSESASSYLQQRIAVKLSLLG